MIPYNLTKGNCKPKNKSNIFRFISGGILNLSEELFFDLSESDMFICSSTRQKIKLDPKQVVRIDCNFIALHDKCDNFLLANAIKNRTNDSRIEVSITSIVNDNVEDFSLDIVYENMLDENVYNWSNFDNQPYNYSITNWDEIVGSWSFYSTINSTTNIIMFKDFTISGYEFQVVNGADTIFYVEKIENNSRMVLELKYSSGLITLISISINGRFVVDETKIVYGLTDQTNSNSEVFFRYVSVFDEIIKHFVSHSLNKKEYYIYNHNDSSTTIDSLSGTLCEDEDLLLDSDCL